MSMQPEALGALFEMSRDAVLGIDSDQRIAFANPVATSLLGVKPGLPASDVLPDYLLENTSERFLTSANIAGQRANVSVVRTEGYTVVTYAVVKADAVAVSPISAKSLQDLSSYLMSTRLAMDALIGHTRADAEPSTLDAVGVLYRDHFRMKRLALHMTLAIDILQDALPFEPRLVDLRTLCRDLCQTVEKFAEEMSIQVSFHCEKGIHLTMADPHLLEIMLLNLMTNSLNHPGEGRQIDLSLKHQRDRFIITVEDKGTGISPEQMSNLFSHRPLLDLADPSAGAGLGLFVARGIAERHEGALVLAVQNDQGTTVSISLPEKRPETPSVNCPVTTYRADGMNMVLTELSVLLDKKHYNRRMFD